MPPLKNAIAAALKSKFVEIPRIGDARSYKAWLNILLRIPHNKKVFARSDKQFVDDCFRDQATEQFKNDNNGLKTALRELEQPASKHIWQKWQAVVQQQSRSHTEGLDGLLVPRIAPAPGIQNRDVWTYLNYKQFAQDVERRNPDKTITKTVMDTAFESAVSRVSRSVDPGARTVAIARCLGKESRQYWKDR